MSNAYTPPSTCSWPNCLCPGSCGRKIGASGSPALPPPSSQSWHLHMVTASAVHRVPPGGGHNIRGPGDSIPMHLRPDRSKPDTLGWRVWRLKKGVLHSPDQGTPWKTAILRASNWSDADAVRGAAGIHAALLPLADWRLLDGPEGYGNIADPFCVSGIVERYGRFVLGTTGWRAEKVVIRELLAKTTEIGLLLEARYPDVKVYYLDQIIGENPCTLVTSSRSVKGNRSTSPSLSKSQQARLSQQAQLSGPPSTPPSPSPSPPASSPPMRQSSYLYTPPSPPTLTFQPDDTQRPSLLRQLLAQNWFWWICVAFIFYQLSRLFS